MSLMDSVQNFKSGQIYEVLSKTNTGKFTSTFRQDRLVVDDEEFDSNGELRDENQKFLIYILKDKTTFKGEPVTITFFKDITFGVLYENLKAQDELLNLIT
jgi:hypothetical protein